MTIVYEGFGVVDYVICGVLLLVSAAIGVYYRFSGGRQRSTKEYLLADRGMSFIPVGFSLMASFMSSITLLGVSSENYMYGTQFVLINLSYVIGTPIAAYFYLPVFYRLQTTSAYQYLEMRFGKATRLAASCAFVIQMVLYMGIVLLAPALALSAVTGLNKAGSIFAVGLVCTFYSTIGGMKAVLITDVFQSLLMFAAVISVAVKGSVDAGGVDKVWQAANKGGRIQFWDFNTDVTIRHTFWTQVIGGIFTYCSLYAVNQTQVQRLLTVSSLRRAQLALWLNWPILTALSLTTSFAGLAIYWQYAYCDPIREGRISSQDQLLPLYVVESMGHLPGLAGMFVAGIFSGSLSTISSALNSLAAVTMQDFLVPVFFKDTPDNRLVYISQVIALIYGGVSLAIAFGAESWGGILQASLTIFGVVGGPLLGLFTLGMFSTAVEQKGALTGLILGLAFSLWIGLGGPKPPIPRLAQNIDGCPEAVNSTVFSTVIATNQNTTIAPPSSVSYFPLYELSYMWYAPLGFLVTIVGGQVISRIINGIESCRGRPQWKVDEQLLSPVFPKCLRTHVYVIEPKVLLVDSGVESKNAIPSAAEHHTAL